VAKEPKSQRRIIKSAPTVREQASQHSANKAPKKSGIFRLAGHYIALPFKWLGRGLKKIGRFIIPSYFRNSWHELKLVTWPTRRESWQLTLAVILFAVIFGALVTIVDYGLDKVFRKVLLD